jgi:hypothetical protein
MVHFLFGLSIDSNVLLMRFMEFIPNAFAADFLWNEFVHWDFSLHKQTTHLAFLKGKGRAHAKGASN